MALFKIEKGLATNLLTNRPNAVEGYCYFTTDDGKFYIDTKSGSLTSSNPTGTRVALNANYSSKLLFGEITQSSSSTLKVSTVNNLSSLVHGTIVVLKNNGSNTAANANLNINNLGSKPIYVNGNPITENTWRANEVAILFYDATSYSGTTGVWSLIPGVTYIHPQYTARTGVPTANQTPAFGGTFSVNQITSDSTGHVTAATSRTITIPSTLSNGNGTAGLIKTSSTVTSNSGYTACPVIDGVPYYKDTNTTYTLGSFGINATATELNYSSGLTGNIQTQLNNKSSSTHTHNYAGSSSAGGPATSAVKLDSSAGSATNPIYFSEGKPAACTYTLNKSVPSDAVFTDTVYTHPTTPGNKHIPSGGSSGQILRWSADGAAAWGSDSDTKNTAGSTDTSSKIFLVGATSQAANPQTYSHDTAYVGTDGCLYSNSKKVSVDGHTHNYAGSSSAGGSATSAVKLDTTSAGSSTQPVYFSSGKPVACTYTLDKSVPSDAKFTDTTYSNATTSTDGLMSSSDKTKLDGIATGATKITVDSALSSTSTNPVQNKVIYGAISSKADLDTSGKVLSSQLPSYVDDVLEYSAKSNFPSTGESGKIYIDTATNLTYRWSGSAYVEISQSLALGETSSTAYRGDRGKIAYDHSQTSHAPTNAEVNQNAFSNVKVGSTTVSADSKTDTLELVAGTNVTLTPDATNDKVTITTNDTKNTAGSTDTSSKIFLVGATSQAANPQTYSHDTAYVGSDGCLYSNNTKVSVNGHTHTVANISDLTATAAELNYCDGVTSNIQTQLNNTVKLSGNQTISGNKTFNGVIIFDDPDASITPSIYTDINNSLKISVGEKLFWMNSDGQFHSSADGRFIGSNTLSSYGVTGVKGNAESSYRKGNVNITAANIGAAASSHNHSASNITSGTLGGKVVANASAVSAITDKQLRNITISTAVPTSSDGENGDIWLVY